MGHYDKHSSKFQVRRHESGDKQTTGTFPLLRIVRAEGPAVLPAKGNALVSQWPSGVPLNSVTPPNRSSLWRYNSGGDIFLLNYCAFLSIDLQCKANYILP